MTTSIDGPDAATVRIMDALRRIVRELSASARGRSGDAAVSGAQRFLLRQIAAAPGLSVGDLAERTLARQSTVSEVVARLERRGLVVRRPSPDDARQVHLTLTDLGRTTADAAEPTAQERLATALGTLSAAECAQLAGGLEAWLAAAGLDTAPAVMFFEEPAAPSAAPSSAAPSSAAPSSGS